jgi:hypothetical protein
LIDIVQIGKFIELLLDISKIEQTIPEIDSFQKIASVLSDEFDDIFAEHSIRLDIDLQEVVRA